MTTRNFKHYVLVKLKAFREAFLELSRSCPRETKW